MKNVPPEKIRFARPEVMVPATLFLATQDASGVSGQHLDAIAWLRERGLGAGERGLDAGERWAARGGQPSAGSAIRANDGSK